MVDSVAERIQALLKEKGMTVKGLSTVTGISLNTLYSITKRKSNKIRRENLEQIAAALDVSPEYLLIGAQEDTAAPPIPSNVTVDENGKWHAQAPKTESERAKMVEEFANLPEDIQRQFMELAKSMTDIQKKGDPNAKT